MHARALDRENSNHLLVVSGEKGVRAICAQKKRKARELARISMIGLHDNNQPTNNTNNSTFQCDCEQAIFGKGARHEVKSCAVGFS
jgi:hypothetical protein